MNNCFKIYSSLINDSNDPTPKECSEVTIQATPEILRKIASLMTTFADQIESSKKEDIQHLHLHLQDFWKEWKRDYPDFIVFPPPVDVN